MYAIFESGGKQHRAEPGQRLFVEKLPQEIGAAVQFNQVLLVSDLPAGGCRIGSPYVGDARVAASVVSHRRAPKILVLKRKRRKGYRVKRGHRQAQTEIRIDAISLGEEKNDGS